MVGGWKHFYVKKVTWCLSWKTSEAFLKSFLWARRKSDLANSFGDLFCQPCPYLPIPLHTGIKTASLFSPKTPFRTVLLLAKSLASPSALQKRDVSIHHKQKWIRFGKENAFFSSVIKHTLTRDFISKWNNCALGWKSCEHLLQPVRHCLHVINLSSSQ